MFDNLKLKIAEYIVKNKFARKQKSGKDFQKFLTDANKVLIILPKSANDIVTEAIEIIRFLAIHKKELYIIHTKEQQIYLPTDFKYASLIVSPEDKTKMGLPNKTLIGKIKKHSFDLVFDLNREVDLFSVSLSNIPLLKKNSDYFYNFQIPNEINPEKSYRNLLNSLRMF